MKSLMTAVSLMIASAAMAQSRAVTHIDSEKVAAALAGARGVVGSLVATKDFTVSGIKRTTPGQVEIHDHETDIFYVTDGEATFVTGGTIVGGKQTASGQTRGPTRMADRRVLLKKGDVITIPAGVPHWFKEVSPSISYMTVKVIK